MPNFKNKWNYAIGDVIQLFSNEPGFIIDDMYRDDERHRVFLVCRCLICNKVKHVRADIIPNSPGSVSHRYCNIISKGIGDEYKNVSEYYNKTRSAFYSAHNRCENPKYHCYHRYHDRGIIVSEDFSKTDDGLRNWLNYLIPLLQDRIETGISNGEFTDVKDALNTLSLDRIDDNGNYEYGNIRWTTPDVQIQNRNCMSEFYAISPSGDRYISNNCTRFARENGLIPKGVITSVRHNGYYKDWYFYKDKDHLFKFDYSKIDLNDKRY